MNSRGVLPLVLCIGALSFPSFSSAQSESRQPAVASQPAGDLILLWKRALTGETKSRVEELEQQVVELRTQGQYGDAIPRAEEVAAHRAREQGEDHWQAADAQRLVATLKLIAGLSAEARDGLAEADRATAQLEQLLRRGKYEAALQLARRQLEIRTRWLGAEHAEVGESLCLTAAALGAMNQFASAEALLREGLAMQRKLLGAEHRNVAVTLNNLAELAWKQGKYDEAERSQSEALAIDRKLFGENQPDVAGDVNNMGMLRLARGDLRGAEALLRDALSARRSLFPEGHEDLAMSLGNLGGCLKELGEYTQAESLFREALLVQQKLSGEDTPDIATCLDNLGMVRLAKGEYLAAEDTLRRALAMRRTLLGDEHLGVATSLHHLAMLQHERGEYAEAERLYGDSRALLQKWLGDDHPDIAKSLASSALLLQNQGDYAAAESTFRESLALARRAQGNEHPDVASILSQLAGLLERKGDYLAAEPMYREALATQRRTLGDEHPLTAATLNNLAGLLQVTGDPAGAEAAYQQALAIARKVFGTQHDYVANTLNNLAALAQDRGDLEAAERLFRQALDMHRTLLGDDHPGVATDLQNLANLLRAKGDYSAAEPVFRQALATLQTQLGYEHPSVANCLNNLAYLLQLEGDLAGAELLYRDALTICEQQRTRVIGGERERALFGGSLRLAGISARLARVLLQLERPDEAFAVLERGRGRVILDLLSRAERDLVAEARTASDGETGAALGRALDAENALRQALTTAEAALVATQKRPDLTPGDKQSLLAKQGEETRLARRKLADGEIAVLAELRLIWPDAQPLGTEQVRAALAPGELLLVYSWADDGLTLFVVPPQGDGVVEGHALTDGSHTAKTLAGQAHQLGRMLALAPDSNVESGDLEAFRSELAEQLLPPGIRPRVRAAQRVIVLPDGPLTQVPLEALTLRRDEGQAVPLVELGPQFVYAESATVYVNRRMERAKRRNRFATQSSSDADALSAVIVGNPDFAHGRRAPEYPSQGVLLTQVVERGHAATAGLTRGDVLLVYNEQAIDGFESLATKIAEVSQQVESGQRKTDDPIAIRYWRAGDTHEATVPPGKLGVQLDRGSPREGLQLLAMRGRGAAEATAEVSATDQARLFGKFLQPLPGTEREAKALAALFHAAVEREHASNIALLLGDDATVGQFEVQVPGKRFVHIATHGLPGSRARPYDASLALTQPDTPSPQDIGFLTLDHLIRNWRGKLDRCELVVLSACDTQRGVKLGDSALALPWGFMFAGAPTVVASLWKVDDTATALLMMRFYGNLLGSRDSSSASAPAAHTAMCKAEALREAKSWLRGLSATDARRVCAAHDLPEPGVVDRGQPGPMRSPPVAEHPFEHPYFWSAFVLIGDPQ